MDTLIIFEQDRLEDMVFVLMIHSMWARLAGGNGVCVNVS